MIVMTLKGTVIKGHMIITECGMLKVKEGDLLFALPKLALDLMAKYPENLIEDGEIKDVKDWPEGAKYLLAQPDASTSERAAGTAGDKKLKLKGRQAEGKSKAAPKTAATSLEASQLAKSLYV